MIIAANFKTNHTRKSTAKYIEALNLFLDAHGDIKSEIVIFPTATSLQNIKLHKDVSMGAQNFYPTYNGSITGEIGYEQLSEFNIKHVLIGHSERRLLLNETQDFVAKKYEFAKDKNIGIIYCIGEPKEVREQGFEFVMNYLWSQFDGIDLNNINLTVAYEPVWAIGTGVSATIEDIENVLNALREKLMGAPILYGGSVNSDNVSKIISLKNCDGVLVGSASLDVASFCELIKHVENT